MSAKKKPLSVRARIARARQAGQQEVYDAFVREMHSLARPQTMKPCPAKPSLDPVVWFAEAMCARARDPKDHLSRSEAP